MLPYPQIDPVLITLGPVQIHWYGVMYLLGFVLAWWFGTRRAKLPHSGWQAEAVGDLIFYGALGVVFGGRIGYMLFYNLSGLLANPLTLFKVWDGGMSFHGGLLGVLIALACFARKVDKSFFAVTDFVAPLVPLGLATGRIGNFINGELWGHATTMPWGMIFPSGGAVIRHPSQLYEFLLEGVVLFIGLWLYSAKPRPEKAVSAWFLLGYGCFRFLVEFFRQPDPQYGYLAWGWVTMGQLLCVPMIVGGLLLLYLAHRQT